jgi:glycosyltransferase involved in cell wall biosynthesis
MRIAVLSTLASGGAANAAWRITRALADFGHECSFFVLEGSGNPLQISLLENDEAFWLPALFRHWGNLTIPEAMIAHATELFSDTVTVLNVPPPEAICNADVIHLHWVAGMLFSPALLSAMAGKKVVWTLHDENAFTGGCHYAGICRAFESQCRNCPLLKNPGPDDSSARCFHLKKQLYLRMNPSLVTPSAWLAEEVKTSALLGNYPVTVIPHPLDTEKFRPSQDKPALRKKLGLPEDTFVILSGCESMDNVRKNTKALFKALALLSVQSPNLPITIMLYGYGQPPELTFPVHHFGYVHDETTLAELYGAADLFVHTSLQEALGLTLCEAQACGSPALSFAVGGCPETMLPGKTGFIVDETTPHALAEKIREIIAARDDLAVMREAARAFAIERFDPHTAAAAYTEVFEHARTAPGLKTTDPLYADLVQNQIASAALFYGVSKEFDNRLGGVEARLEAQVNGLRQEIDALRWNLRHPFRWLFRKLSSELRGGILK